MSIRGTVTVECDSRRCQSEFVYTVTNVDDIPVRDKAEDEGWRFVKGKAQCPACVEPTDRDGESFRGGEAAGYQREQQVRVQRELK